jgi:hypothetical protein
MMAHIHTGGHTYIQETHIHTRDTQTDRGHTCKRGAHIQTVDTYAYRGTHTHTRGHTDRHGAYRQTGGHTYIQTFRITKANQTWTFIVISIVLNFAVSRQSAVVATQYI